MLFSLDDDEQPLATEVSDVAIQAAVNIVKTACQQTAYIAGRGTLEEEFQKYKTGTQEQITAYPIFIVHSRSLPANSTEYTRKLHNTGS